MLALAAAQAPAPPPLAAPQPLEDGSVLVAELEVIGRPPGPPLWRVRKGDGEVVVLGATSPLPHQLKWNERAVVRALDGAKALLAPPAPAFNPFEAPGLLAKLLSLKSRTPLARRAPPAVYARVVQAAAVARTDPKVLQGWDPGVAGFILLDRFERAAGLSRGKPGTTVARLAKAAGVPVKPLARVRAVSALDAFVKMDERRQDQCLDAAAGAVLWEAGHAVPAAEAWAQGRLAEARRHRSDDAFDVCLEGAPGARALLEKSLADSLAAVESALAGGGRTVAVIDLRLLDRRGGLLDRLRARGAEITVPAD